MKLLIQIVGGLLLAGFAVGGPLSRKEIAKPRLDNVNYRLPTSIEPLHYTLKLIPDIDNGKFTGSVKIIINVKEPTSSITLHYKDLDIKESDIKISDGDSNIIAIDKLENGTIDQEFLIILLKTGLAKGTYTLEFLNFVGVLNTKNKGFYLAKFKDENGTEHKFATTQFEPTNARKAFPCFDEPALKAKFKIFLTKPNDKFNSISNTPVINTSGNEDEFDETPEMSTYLIAFIVSEMKISSKKNHRVLAKPQDIKDETEQYALNTGIKILNAIEEFVDVEYTLPKMDQAAIPDKYFSAGAMENWGLVTYKETYLLKSNKSTTTNMHQSITTIIAHEFGHQWFGNLVSPKWWEYIWLNEGFATYFEHLGASLVETDWRIMDQFVVKNTQYVFGPDSLENTRAMNQAAGSPTDISNLFDRIAYEKSGSVIRMMEGFLTTAVFKSGLKIYLDKMAKKSATPADLYEHLQTAIDKNSTVNLPFELSRIMKSWDSQLGYPVLDVKRNYTEVDQEKIFVNQSRFFLKNATTDDRTFWIVPLNYATKTVPDFSQTYAEGWLKEKEENITVAGLRKEDWLIINKQETGYYRVNYDDINWKKLIDALVVNYNSIHLLNRAQLLDDAFNLARSGRLSYEIPFKLSIYLMKETDYIPLYSFFTAATFLNTMLSGTPAHSRFKVHVLTLLGTVHEQLGYDENQNDKHLDKLNRENVLKWMCNMGDTECRETALKKFRAWKEDESKIIPLDLQAPVFCGAMRSADQNDWNFLYSKYAEVVNGDDSALQSRIRSALGCPENVAILEYFINNADDSIITLENVFASIYNSGSIGVTFAFEHVITNFDKLYEKLENRMGSILTGIGSKLTTPEQLIKLKKLNEIHVDQTALFLSAIANAQENVNWNVKYLFEISTLLSIYSGSGTILDILPTSFVVTISIILYKLAS